MTVHVAAIDLGASSGRVVLGEVGPGVLRTEAVARFPNEPVRLPDGLHWNLVELYRQALAGLRVAAGQATLASVGIDSWAVDYGLIGAGRLLGIPYHYRDARCDEGVERVHKVAPHAELYRVNGLQFLPFNTLYQLAIDPLAAQADRMLMVPDLIAYWLTGEMTTERTNASTTGLLDVSTGAWDLDLASRLGIPSGILGGMVSPGDPIGELLPHVADAVGSRGLTVSAVGTHDTASAVVGVPIQTDDAAYISCGTWALVGLELESPVLTDESRAANFTNEGGVDGRTRFLTNVMGLWLLSECMRAWARDGGVEPLPELLAAAAALPVTPRLFDVQDSVFLPPDGMPQRIQQWYAERGFEPPASRPAMVRAVVDSLAQAFAEAVDRAETLSGQSVNTIHLVGGGALNHLLCQVTADRSGRTVLAGPIEATSIGNVLVQGRTVGALSGSLESLRQLVVDTSEIVRFDPTPSRMAT